MRWDTEELRAVSIHTRSKSQPRILPKQMILFDDPSKNTTSSTMAAMTNGLLEIKTKMT